MELICKYCGRILKRPCALAIHERTCKCNPDRKPLENQVCGYAVHKNPNYVKTTYSCKYCGEEFTNKKLYTKHENNCVKNTNRNKRTAWNKGLTKETDERVRKYGETYSERCKTGEITPTFKDKHHTEETKKKLSKIRKEWLSEHKDEHVWKRNSKFISVPCENLKEYLRSKNIEFEEEYEPFREVNYSVDIAFPDHKIGIEVNGNQHYNRDGSLREYYQKRHDYFSENGWILYEIHYTKCYKIDINDFEDILKLPIYDIDYVKERL